MQEEDTLSDLKELLLRHGLVSDRDLQDAIEIQREGGSNDLGASLVKLGAISEERLLGFYSAELDLPIADEAILPSGEAVAETARRLSIPLSWLTRNGVLVWFAETMFGELLCLAGASVFKPEVQEAAERWHEGPKSFRLTTSRAVELRLATTTGERQSNAGSPRDPTRLRELAEEAPVIDFVQTMFADAIAQRVSDIHVEPFEDLMAVRFRVDGMLLTWRKMPRTFFDAVASRLKLLSQMDIAERRLPQDGRQSIRVAGAEIDLRVSSLPTAWGESLVIRFLGKTRSLPTLEGLGFGEDDISRLLSMIGRPNGMLIVSGPTGSGKTTTVYRLISHLNDGRRKIVMLEDPIEMDLPGVLQMAVRSDIGLDFATGLRSILRQDPDVIFVGEIRDAETARIAVQAALTGHLVITTVHTSSAIGAVTRLADLGIEPFLLAEVTIGLVAQRLLRRSCSNCAGEGCPTCGASGFNGRVGAFEIVSITDALAAAIRGGADQAAMTIAARADHSRSLLEDARGKVRRGLTTEAEALRVLGT